MVNQSFDLKVPNDSSNTDKAAQNCGIPKSVTFEIHHGGCFTPTPSTSYIGGQVSSVNVVDIDEFCVHGLKDMVVKLGYGVADLVYFYFLRPRLGLDYGIDADVLEMEKYVKDYKIILVYVEHGSSNVDTSIFVTPKKEVAIAVDDHLRKGPIEIDNIPDPASSVEGPIIVESVDDPFRDLDEILGTTVRIDVQQEPNPESLTRTFKRMSLAGQILRAVGVDANNGIYRVEYVIVEAKSKASWCWFLKLLGEDLGIESNFNYIFISDRQKEMLWNAAKATSVGEFNKMMVEIKSFISVAYDGLMKILVEQWTRSYFLGRAKCDLLIKNIFEVINRQLVDGRDQPIITCLEYIREYLMKRIVVVQKVIAKNVRPLTPSMTAVFDAIKKAIEYIVHWNGGHLYQVTGTYKDHCVVNMDTREFSCRKWKLTRIPCKHVVDALYNMSKNSIGVGIPKKWVHAAYRLEKRAHVYSFKINPCNGREMWPVVEFATVIIPHIHKPQVGRPPKKRKKSYDEITIQSASSSKLSRKGKPVKCSKCGNVSHNRKGCRGQGGASQAGGSSQAGARQAIGARNIFSKASARGQTGARQAAGARNASSQTADASQPSADQAQQANDQLNIVRDLVKEGCRGQGGASQAGGSSQAGARQANGARNVFSQASARGQTGARQAAGARNSSSQTADASQPSADQAQQANDQLNIVRDLVKVFRHQEQLQVLDHKD
nr:hypothetical protein [Tanacetum cinerariifolium]